MDPSLEQQPASDHPPHHSHDHPHGHSHDSHPHHDHPHDLEHESGHNAVAGSLFTHSHDGLAEHSHPTAPGSFYGRDPYARRDYSGRAFTVGIGGPVGSGKTALVLALCRRLHPAYSLVVVTNDIFTREDCEFLHRHSALGEDGNARIRAVETGGCPHAAIREDCSHNLQSLSSLSSLFHPDLALLESGGDNLAANFSRELADIILYVIDVAGGDKIPRKGGPGITQSDLLVINKTDLAQRVGADLELMEREARRMRDEDGPVVMAQVKHGVGVEEIAQFILTAWRESGASRAWDERQLAARRQQGGEEESKEEQKQEAEAAETAQQAGDKRKPDDAAAHEADSKRWKLQ